MQPGVRPGYLACVIPARISKRKPEAVIALIALLAVVVIGWKSVHPNQVQPAAADTVAFTSADWAAVSLGDTEQTVHMYLGKPDDTFHSTSRFGRYDSWDYNVGGKIYTVDFSNNRVETKSVG